MLNSTILLKVKERLNKLDSSDFDNLPPWTIIEAFNKGQVDWCRRNLHGLNIVKEGDEQSTRRIDDLQPLLTPFNLIVSNKQTYYESNLLPTNYLQWKRISCKGKSECCEDARPMRIYLAEQANRDVLLADKLKQPSFEWGETFATLEGNRIQIYTNGLFEVVSPVLTFYRQPTRIEIAGVKDPYTNLVPTVDVQADFKDDLIELFIDECAKILAGDIESMTAVQIESQRTESNN